jgi:hypothetical protein
MKYKKIVGLGALIWGIAFITAAIFVAFSAIDTILAKIVVPFAVGVAAFFGGKMIDVELPKDILKYSIVWVVIGLLLDLVVTVPFTGWGIFAQWNVWLGYALILFAPLLGKRNPFMSQTPGRTPQNRF